MFFNILKYKFLGDYTQDFFFKQLMQQSFAGQNAAMFFYLELETVLLSLAPR